MDAWWLPELPTSPAVLAILLGTTVLGGALRGITGFGAALLMAPVYTFFIAPQSATFAILFMNLIASVQIFWACRHDVPWATVARMSPAALVMIPVGTWVLSGLDPDLLRRVVGVVVVVLSLLLWSGWRYRGRRGIAQDSAVGATAGILQGMAAIGGPPVIFYLIASDLTVQRVRAALTAFFGFTSLASMVSLMVGAGVGTTDMVRAVWLLPLHLFGTLLGSLAFVAGLKHGDRAMRKVSIALLTAVGVLAVLL